MSYRWRSGRMADLGYADFYEALEVFGRSIPTPSASTSHRRAEGGRRAGRGARRRPPRAGRRTDRRHLPGAHPRADHRRRRGGADRDVAHPPGQPGAERAARPTGRRGRGPAGDRRRRRHAVDRARAPVRRPGGAGAGRARRGVADPAAPARPLARPAPRPHGPPAGAARAHRWRAESVGARGAPQDPPALPRPPSTIRPAPTCARSAR